MQRNFAYINTVQYHVIKVAKAVKLKFTATKMEFWNSEER